jgi:hypothetical protein
VPLLATGQPVVVVEQWLIDRLLIALGKAEASDGLRAGAMTGTVIAQQFWLF